MNNQTRKEGEKLKVIVPDEPLKHIPQAIHTAIDDVLEYLWYDEMKHFEEYCVTDPNAWTGETGHVFPALCVLRSYFEAKYHHPQQYMCAENE